MMTCKWRIEMADLDDLGRLAGELAPVLRPGDFIALDGALGTGKTAFARALISSLLEEGGNIEIPSPTFSLLQRYDETRLPVFHYDFYRLTSPCEVLELGLDEALREGVVIAEWPERLEDRLPADRLTLSLLETADPGRREIELTGMGEWVGRLARLHLVNEFLDAADWEKADRRFLQGDASTRVYIRLGRDGGTAILMDAPRQPDGPPVRDGRPYSAIARLAEDIRPFVAISNALRSKGFSAPEILARDFDAGLVLLEDLGDRVFGAEIAAGHKKTPLYTRAVEVLAALRQTPPPEHLPVGDGPDHRLPAFDWPAFEIEISLLLDWFWPALHGSSPGEDVRQSFFALWSGLFEKLLNPLLASPERNWMLRDFHSPNLLWLPDRTGLAAVGLIDFQDALRGPPAYDLVSLLQDARIDMPESLEALLFEHYCSACAANDSRFDEDRFKACYALLGAQRNTKIMGIFARLAKRDGKPGYLAHLPRIAGYLTRNLAHPALKDLRAWYDRHLAEDRRAGLLKI